MNAAIASLAALHPSTGVPNRGRPVRDQDTLQRFGFQEGAAYRIAYVAGGAHLRRVSRSVVLFVGTAERRRWDGESAACLEFVLPHGRQLSLLSTQLVDVRATELNDRGQWVLREQGELVRRHTPGRRVKRQHLC